MAAACFEACLILFLKESLVNVDRLRGISRKYGEH